MSALDEGCKNLANHVAWMHVQVPSPYSGRNNRGHGVGRQLSTLCPMLLVANVLLIVHCTHLSPCGRGAWRLLCCAMPAKSVTCRFLRGAVPCQPLCRLPACFLKTHRRACLTCCFYAFAAAPLRLPFCPLHAKRVRVTTAVCFLSASRQPDNDMQPL